MKTTIYYFSGTGNSLNVAKNLKNQLEDVEITPIVTYINDSKVEVTSEKVIFVTPTYYYKVPSIVENFIKKMVFKNKPYIAFIATSGGGPGYVLNHMDQLLEEKNQKLSYGCTMNMVDNSIAIKQSEEERQKKLASETDDIRKISQDLLENAKNEFSNEMTFKNKAYNKVLEVGFRKIIGIERKKCDKNTCSQCGLCQKVCPVNCISMDNGHPQWSDKCVECMACIQWCPNQSISFGFASPKKNGSYHHPNIKIKEIMAQKENL